MVWVVRAGEAKAFDLVNGYGPHRAVAGLYGFSVQYHVGKTVEELAQAGQFPNALISYQDEAVLAQTLQPLGYSFRLVPSPGKGCHHTFVVRYDASSTMQQRLPMVVAQALEAAFLRLPNPHRVPRGTRRQP